VKSVDFKGLKQQGHDALKRGLDQHLRLAVTGLSGAGKTAFVTGLLEQLLHGDAQHQPFWQARRDGRIYGAQLAAQPDRTLPRFAYEQALAALLPTTDDPAQWPPSTLSLSQIRTLLKVNPQHGWRAKFTDQFELTIDILDYPGEWLLDLPLLTQSYQQWSEAQQQLQGVAPRTELSQSWHQAFIELANSDSPASDVAIAAVAAHYRTYLENCRAHGLSLLQPGRALLPGDLAGAPVVDLMPWPAGLEQSAAPELWQALETRYRDYREQVIKPFFKKYFRRFNRQVVLIDVLGALRNGHAALIDLQAALHALQDCFQYGDNSVLRRLLGARVEKVMLLATKADAVVADSYPALLTLLSELVLPWQNALRYQAIPVQLDVVAALRSTEQGRDSQGKPLLRGLETDADGSLQQVTFRPEPLPASIHEPTLAAYHWFTFEPYFPTTPASGYRAGHALPHVRMDRVLEFLLGDIL